MWVIWDYSGEPVAVTDSDSVAEAAAMEGKDYSDLKDEPEWFQDWAERTLKRV